MTRKPPPAELKSLHPDIENDHSLEITYAVGWIVFIGIMAVQVILKVV